MIRMETVPCWYELSWRGEQGIVLRIHTDYAKATKQIPADAPIVGYYMESFGFSKFSGEFGKNLGFEDLLPFLGERDGFQEYSVPTPLIRKTNGECSHCEGSGKRDVFDFDEKCLYCDGEGKNIVYDYQEAYAISATLTILFELMRFPEMETSCQLPQLMCVHTVTIADSHGGTVGGEYSREAVEWMKKRGAGDIPEMVSAMRSVWEKMDGQMKSFYDYSFRADLGNDSGWLCTDCPGDACGLHPAHDASYDVQRGLGYEFSSHNVDTPQQQLTIIASLAALHDLMRRGA